MGPVAFAFALLLNDALVFGRTPFPATTRFLGVAPGGVGACAGGVGIGRAGEELARAL